MKKQWPTIDEKAYRGLAGTIAETIAPHSEADPVALLVQTLACAGNVIGRRFYYPVESDRHHANLFVLLIGTSSKARKGTSLGRITSVVKLVDPAWADERIKSGLSSGEGLINEVRDEVNKWRSQDNTFEIIDPGITDKRLMVVEPEFAGALSVMERHGNTLSPMIRLAWDGHTMRTMAKSSPNFKATNAHISIIGHITEDELRARLSKVNMANGFANRFLFAGVARSKELPFGGNLEQRDIEWMGKELGETLNSLNQLFEQGDAPKPVYMGEDARKLWEAAYHDLSAEKPGMHGAVTARSEAQVCRMAMIYALLDGETTISAYHLEAALALWGYCDASARIVFGDTVGDPLIDTLRAELKAAGEYGLTRTAINNILSGHQSSERIDAALTSLLEQGLARREIATTAGRPVATWFAAAPSEKAEQAEKGSSVDRTAGAEKAEEAEKGVEEAYSAYSAYSAGPYRR